MGISRAGDFEPLVAESVFRRVQLRLAGKVEPTTHVKDRDDFPLRRFLTCARCGKPVTGSWSTGRNGRYGYCHCPKCSGVRGRCEKVEASFLSHLEGLRPDPAYVRLLNAIVLDVWRAEQGRVHEVQQLRSKCISELRTRLDRLEEAFIFERSIDHTVYERQRDKLQEELTLAELELHDARIDRTDVEGVLAFAEHLLTNTGSMWLEASLPQRQQIQRAILPDGLPVRRSRFWNRSNLLSVQLFTGSSRRREWNGVPNASQLEPDHRMAEKC